MWQKVNKQSVWIVALILLVLLLAACGATAFPAVEPALNEDAGATPANALATAVAPLGAETQTDDTQDSTPTDEGSDRNVGDPLVIERDEALELVPVPEGALPESFIPDNSPAVLSDIVADMFARSGSKTDKINVVKMEAVTWTDGALGCPEPGRLYTQAFVEGYWIILEIDGVRYDYRATQSGDYRLCENSDS